MLFPSFQHQLKVMHVTLCWLKAVFSRADLFEAGSARVNSVQPRAECILGCIKQRGQQVKRGDSPPVFSFGAASSWILLGVLDCTTQKRMLRLLEALRGGTKDGSRAGGMSCEEAEGTGGVQPGEEADRWPHCSLQHRGEGKQSEVPGSAPSWELLAEGEWHRAMPGLGTGKHFCPMRGQIKEQASSGGGW